MVVKCLLVVFLWSFTVMEYVFVKLYFLRYVFCFSFACILSHWQMPQNRPNFSNIFFCLGPTLLCTFLIFCVETKQEALKLYHKFGNRVLWLLTLTFGYCAFTLPRVDSSMRKRTCNWCLLNTRQRCGQFHLVAKHGFVSALICTGPLMDLVIRSIVLAQGSPTLSKPRAVSRELSCSGATSKNILNT